MTTSTARHPYIPLSVLAVEKQMTARQLLGILQAAGVTCFRLGTSWQVSQPEFDAFEERCADEARHAVRVHAEESQR